MNYGKVARDADAMMSEADATAAKVCTSLYDEHEWRAKYFKAGKIHKYSLRDTVWVERHHKDVLTRHRQQSWYIPGVIVRKIRQDVYAVQVGDNKILDRDHTQLRPRAPDPSGRAVTFEFTAGDLDSDNDNEEADYTAERILTDKPDPATPGAIQGSQERICRFARLVGASEQFCSEVYHGVAGLSQEKGDNSRCQGCLGALYWDCARVLCMGAHVLRGA